MSNQKKNSLKENNKLKDNKRKLSILFEQNGFSFCVFKENEITHAEKVSWDDNDQVSLSAILKKNLYMQQPYDEVVVTILNNRFNIIPNDLAREESWENWLEFNAEVYQNEPILNKPLLSDNTLVYTYSNELSNNLNTLFSQYTLKHAAEVFITSIQQVGGSEQVFVNLHHSQMEIMVYNKGQFVFYNQFEYYSKEDFMYYLLSVFKALNLDTNKAELYYFGMKNEDETLLKIMLKYIRHVIPGDTDTERMQFFTLIEALS